MDKAALRKIAAKRRDGAKAAKPGVGDALVRNFPKALIPPPGATVAGYWPFRSEIDPRPLMQALAARGCGLALPVTPPRGGRLPLTFRVWKAADALAPGGFAVHEPGPDAPTVEPNLILAPLLAFDRSGARLGYGQGHYDRTLAGLRARGPVVAIGLAFSAQELESLPTEDHDVPLDGIVTELAYIDVMRTDS